MNIIEMYQESFRTNVQRIALTDYFTCRQYTYLRLSEEVVKLHHFFRQMGLVKGDKVALMGKNDTKWVSIYIGTVTYGAVIVPILPGFNPADAANIINHSDASILFVDDTIWKSINASGVILSNIRAAVSLDDDRPLSEQTPGAVAFGREKAISAYRAQFPTHFDPDRVEFCKVAPDDVMIISYTSGTSGFSKGVMLTVDNITSNVQFALDHKFHFTGSRVLGLLPLAHAYGCAFDMLTPLAAGSHITLLGRTPTPPILLKALADVKPHLICTVPLVMEKIVRKKVIPQTEKLPLSTLLRIPVIKTIVRNKIRKSMLDAFGGCVREVNMGGAAVSEDVEKFLKEIKFPFTVGYGMTECGPLISYEHNSRYRSGSCGTILPQMEARTIGTQGDFGASGEICVRGRNVMKGYYKNPVATSEAIDDEGWLHTGDIGIVESDGTIYLKGRCKSMILNSTGQNIYPEEIESKLNRMPLVMESLVYSENGKLISLIVPDKDEAHRRGLDIKALRSLMDSNLAMLNKIVAPYERIASYRLCSEEFEKTPKRSIRRYLYPMQAKMLS